MILLLNFREGKYKKGSKKEEEEGKKEGISGI